jgi:putative CocE/NonD family hydrolase
VGDQRFASYRQDVLIYESDTLQEDITIAGSITAELYVSTTGTDADWIVKVIDVYPDDEPNPNPNPDRIEMGGYQMMIRGDIFRGKYLNSFEEPESFVPNEVTKVAFDLHDVFHLFKKGHKIMVQVQSSWFPLYDRNPQKFCDIYNADEEDFQKATHRVYFTEEYPSNIRVNFLNQ